MMSKLSQGWGKVRRFWLAKFRPRYVARWRALRRGECRRCGQCCAIMFRCPHLREANQCGVYPKRYEQCKLFPIDPRDLTDVPGRGCGFRFDSGRKA